VGPSHRRPNDPVRRREAGPMRGAERDRGLRGALMWSSGGAAAARFGGALGGVLAARLLGPTGRGQLAVLVFVATAGSMTAAAGGVRSIMVALAWARRAPAGAGVASRGWASYRRALAFGVPGGAGELTLLAMLRVDVLIVAAFLPLRDVGLYAVATALSEVL